MIPGTIWFCNLLSPTGNSLHYFIFFTLWKITSTHVISVRWPVLFQTRLWMSNCTHNAILQLELNLLYLSDFSMRIDKAFNVPELNYIMPLDKISRDGELHTLSTPIQMVAIGLKFSIENVRWCMQFHTWRLCPVLSLLQYTVITKIKAHIAFHIIQKLLILCSILIQVKIIL